MGKAGPLQWPRSVHYALPGHQRNLYPQAEASRTDHPASGTPQATEPLAVFPLSPGAFGPSLFYRERQCMAGELGPSHTPWPWHPCPQGDMSVAQGLFLEVVGQALASLLTTFGALCMALNAASVYVGTSKQTLLTSPPAPGVEGLDGGGLG